TKFIARNGGQIDTFGQNQATFFPGDSAGLNFIDLSRTCTNSVTAPQGRLTLTSGTPVLTQDTTSTTIYYTAYKGSVVPVYNGAQICPTSICTTGTVGTCELSVAMAGNAAWASGSVYDWFVTVNNGTVTICSGPAWTQNGPSPAPARNANLTQLSGIWT